MWRTKRAYLEYSNEKYVVIWLQNTVDWLNVYTSIQLWLSLLWHVPERLTEEKSATITGSRTIIRQEKCPALVAQYRKFTVATKEKIDGIDSIRTVYRDSWATRGILLDFAKFTSQQWLEKIMVCFGIIYLDGTFSRFSKVKLWKRYWNDDGASWRLSS